MSKRRWKQDPEGRRERILGAAADEFGHNGYEKARVDKIAVQAGVAEGTVYHQFGSKRGLLAAVGERYGKGLVEAAFGKLPPEPMPADAETAIRSIFAYVRASHEQLGAFILANQPGEAEAAQTATRSQMVRALESRLKLWSAAGNIAEIDPRIGAQLIYGVTERALRDCFLNDRGRDEQRWVAETTRVVRRYLGAPPS